MVSTSHCRTRELQFVDNRIADTRTPKKQRLQYSTGWCQHSIILLLRWHFSYSESILGWKRFTPQAVNVSFPASYDEEKQLCL
jgi:hypothetical protein